MYILDWDVDSLTKGKTKGQSILHTWHIHLHILYIHITFAQKSWFEVMILV